MKIRQANKIIYLKYFTSRKSTLDKAERKYISCVIRRYKYNTYIYTRKLRKINDKMIVDQII